MPPRQLARVNNLPMHGRAGTMCAGRMALTKAVMKNEKLTTDEYDALEQIARGPKGERISACVSRNAKRLSGLKLVQYARDGRLSITEKAQQALFVRRCIQGLRAVANDPLTSLDADVATFLGKKAHIVPRGEAAGYDITVRGRESLADIDSMGL
jgi:hypothetical protein